MNPLFAIAAAAIFAAPLAQAQHVSEDPQPDSVLDAIHAFNQRDKSKPNEITVVLDPVGVSPVAGKPLQKIAEEPAAEVEAEAPATEPAPAADPPAGLAVHVEKLQTAKGNIDPATVKLLAPFPAKPLAQPPAGWHLDPSETAPPFTREVEISTGSKITLTIRPHLLVPDADGAEVFAIPEPGFDNSLDYQQTATVGAVLSKSIRQLDEDAQQLDSAIQSLEQLLISLPAPAAQPDPKPPVPTTRKR